MRRKGLQLAKPRGKTNLFLRREDVALKQQQLVFQQYAFQSFDIVIRNVALEIDTGDLLRQM